MTLAIWDDGVWQDALAVAIIIVVAYLIVMWIAALIWTYRDIGARTRDPMTQTVSVLTVLIFNLPGLFLYLILRPKDTLADRYDRQLEAEALLHEIQEQATCPACRRRVEDDFIACPYCRAQLRIPCESCAKPLLVRWVVCPYCGAERRAPAGPTPVRAVPASEPSPSTGNAPTSMTTSRVRRASTATYTPPASVKAPPSPAPSTDGADAGT